MMFLLITIIATLHASCAFKIPRRFLCCASSITSQSLSKNDLQQIGELMRQVKREITDEIVKSESRQLNEIAQSEARLMNVLAQSESRSNRHFETLSRKISDLSEESLRKKVGERKGVPWAQPFKIETLEDIVSYLNPLLLHLVDNKITIKRKGSEEVLFNRKCSILLARKLQPFLPMYLEKVNSFLRSHANCSDVENSESATKSTLCDILSRSEKYDEKVLGMLIGAVDNQTWKKKLIRLKKASHLINKKNPSDDELAALAFDSEGPGVLLACGVSQALVSSSSNHHHIMVKGNPFEDLCDPFIDLNDEIEVCIIFSYSLISR